MANRTQESLDRSTYLARVKRAAELLGLRTPAAVDEALHLINDWLRPQLDDCEDEGDPSVSRFMSESELDALKGWLEPYGMYVVPSDEYRSSRETESRLACSAWHRACHSSVYMLSEIARLFELTAEEERVVQGALELIERRRSGRLPYDVAKLRANAPKSTSE